MSESTPAPGTPISYEVLAKGTAVRTVAGRQFGTVEHVLQIPSEDLFDGIVVATHDGIRFVDRDQITTITDVAVTTTLDDAAVESLPKPDGHPIYSVDAIQGDGHDLSDWVNRVFGHGKWKLEKPDDET